MINVTDEKWSNAKVIITALAHLLEQCFLLFTFCLRQRYHRSCLFKLRNFLFTICIHMPIVNWLVGLSCVSLFGTTPLFYLSALTVLTVPHSTRLFRTGKHVVEGMGRGAALCCPTALWQRRVWDIQNTSRRDCGVSQNLETRMPRMWCILESDPKCIMWP